MIRQIEVNPTNLEVPCISVIGNEYIKISEDLIDTANHHKIEDGCVGLAANQIGYHRRMFAMLVDDKFQVFINPKYVFKGKSKKTSVETCLSFPGEAFKVRRSKKVRISYFIDLDGELTKVFETFKGLQARIVQHEMDHLEGILK